MKDDIFGDHKLVISKIKLKLKCTGQERISRQYYSSRVNDPVIKNKFVLKLKNRFQVLKNLNKEAETKSTWTLIKEKFLTAAKEILKHKKKML